MRNLPLPLQVYCKNLEDIENKYPNASKKEVTGFFNMLLLKDNQLIAACEDGKIYHVTT